MGSDDNVITVDNSLPFSIRNYVSEARKQDIRNNWPFHEKYLEVYIKHGINKVLPPFESQEGGGYIGRDKNSCVGVNKGKEVVKVESNTCVDEAVSEITKQTSPLSLSVNKNQQGDSGLSSDVPSLSMDQTIKSFCKKRKKYKGRRKMRLLADIYADARPCTLEDLILANGAVPYASDYGTTENKRCEKEIIGSSTSLDHNNGNDSAWSLKLSQLSTGNEEKNNYVGGRKHIIKIKIGGSKSKADNEKMIT